MDNNKIKLLNNDLLLILRDLSLSARERDVVRLRLGYDDGRKRSVEEISKIFNLPERDIHEMISNVSLKLKQKDLTLNDINIRYLHNVDRI